MPLGHVIDLHRFILSIQNSCISPVYLDKMSVDNIEIQRDWTLLNVCWNSITKLCMAFPELSLNYYYYYYISSGYIETRSRPLTIGYSLQTDRTYISVKK